MKFLISLFISATFILQLIYVPKAVAGEPAAVLEAIGTNYGSKIRRPRHDFQIDRSIRVKPQEFIAHQGQAIILIMILTGVDLVKQHVTNSMITRKSIDSALLLQHAGEAADHILNSGEIWSSLMSASAMSATVSKPMAVIGRMIENQMSRAILKDLLKSGIATFITFVGWELGGQLYNEATEMISDKADCSRSKQLLPLLINSIRLGLNPSSPEYQKDWQILRQVFSNMMTILVYDHDLRNMWLYNTWRNRIVTGEFVTLVTAMVGASMVGTAIFPGAGTIDGMMFGVFGGTLALFIPQETKDGITSVIQSIRFGFWAMGDDRGPFFNVKKDVIRLMYGFVSRGEPLTPLLNFNPNPHASEQMANVIFECLFRFDSRLQLSISLKIAAERAGNYRKAQQLEEQIKTLVREYQVELTKLDDLYSTELKELEQTLATYPILASINDGLIIKYPSLRNIVDYRNRLQKLSGFVSYFTQTIQANMLSDDRLYLPALNRFFIFGFSEDRLLQITGN